MKKVVIMLLVLCFTIYFFKFVKSKRVKNLNLVAVEKNGDSIIIALRESFYYISEIEQNLVNDTLYLKIYKTSIGNIFLKGNQKIIQKKIPSLGAKSVVIDK